MLVFYTSHNIGVTTIGVTTALMTAQATYGCAGCTGGSGSEGLLVCPPECPDADIDIAEAVEAENATTAGATNQTTTNGNMTGTYATGNTSANELGRISGTDGTVSVTGPNTETPITTIP